MERNFTASSSKKGGFCGGFFTSTASDGLKKHSWAAVGDFVYFCAWTNLKTSSSSSSSAKILCFWSFSSSFITFRKGIHCCKCKLHFETHDCFFAQKHTTSVQTHWESLVHKWRGIRRQTKEKNSSKESVHEAQAVFQPRPIFSWLSFPPLFIAAFQSRRGRKVNTKASHWHLHELLLAFYATSAVFFAPFWKLLFFSSYKAFIKDVSTTTDSNSTYRKTSFMNASLSNDFNCVVQFFIL